VDTHEEKKKFNAVASKTQIKQMLSS